MGGLTDLVGARRGHFVFESGHHGDLWLELDGLFVQPGAVAPFAADLARRLAAHEPEVVCGPLVGGAFVAQLVAIELGAELCWSERTAEPSGGLYSAEYRIPAVLREGLRGKRVALVDDVINAGSATRATLADLHACGARLVALGALLVLNDTAARLAAGEGVALESVKRLESALWVPEECPVCRGTGT